MHTILNGIGNSGRSLIFWVSNVNHYSVRVLLNILHAIKDYGIPSTTPLPGEDLQVGSLIRWYLRRVQILAIKVRIINKDLAYYPPYVTALTWTLTA